MRNINIFVVSMFILHLLHQRFLNWVQRNFKLYICKKPDIYNSLRIFTNCKKQRKEKRNDRGAVNFV